ncbi:4-hydroxy-tetrahydrodipicolinate reductase [Terrihabitans soli]|uniref:4-hydroxy-tetrahydrodipicolinate reductase n=1 Tax=Terrihabitans soli TaxID=708113 RepID=A0A6S6QYN8_9HYPH|nr:4-hydroxy-tetrahydrodipicolinate reductase [Terrihabitans soli]BCJ92392.1 4-hydroxy-tetrahydrodipicolinate reductase [Terrihabitans soli]
MRLVVVGAAGRMGCALIRALLLTPGATLAAAIEREGSPALGSDAGALVGLPETGIRVTSDALTAFSQAEGVLDFTSPSATVEFAALAAQARIVHVIGTTGFVDDDLKKLDAAARHAVLIRSGNMSLGVNLLAALVRKAAAALPDFDIEVLEMHHRDKVDAPSGTALLLGDAAASGREVSLNDAAVKSREGHTGARKPGTIGFATLRGGSVVGEHSVILAGPGERLELSHKAEDRGIFAAGAIRAALWGKGRSPGHYSMADVLGIADL